MSDTVEKIGIMPDVKVGTIIEILGIRMRVTKKTKKDLTLRRLLMDKKDFERMTEGGKDEKD